jgi:hypothetical protein
MRTTTLESERPSGLLGGCRNHVEIILPSGSGGNCRAKRIDFMVKIIDLLLVDCPASHVWWPEGMILEFPNGKYTTCGVYYSEHVWFFQVVLKQIQVKKRYSKLYHICTYHIFIYHMSFMSYPCLLACMYETTNIAEMARRQPSRSKGWR